MTLNDFCRDLMNTNKFKLYAFEKHADTRGCVFNGVVSWREIDKYKDYEVELVEADTTTERNDLSHEVYVKPILTIYVGKDFEK